MPSASGRSVPETLLVVALLLLVAALAYGAHVVDGDFYLDDWANGALTQYPGADGWLSAYWSLTSYRPVLVLYVPLTHLVLGESAAAHIAFGVLLAVGMSTALFVLLREIGVGRWDAALIGVLVLLLPSANSTKLWPTASMAHFAITCLLVGALVALRGLAVREAQPRRARTMHAAALGLFALSLLSYEVSAPVLGLSVLLYRLRAPWGPALRRWGADLVVLLASVGWVAAGTPREVSTSADVLLDRARSVLDQGLTILARSASPFGTFGRPTVLLGMVAVVAVALVVWSTLPRDDPQRGPLRVWATRWAAGLLVAGAAWVMFVPADPYYSPLTPGLGNRINALSAVGIVIAVYSTVALVAHLLFRGLQRRRWLVPVASTVLAGVLGLGYLQDVRRDVATWAGAAQQGDLVLGSISRSFGGAPPSGATLWTFGHPGYEAPGVPIFGASWDLHGAIRLVHDDSTLRAYPVLDGKQMVCAADGTYPDSIDYGPPFVSPYGRTYFVDIPSSRALQVTSQASCRALTERVQPGPLIREQP